MAVVRGPYSLIYKGVNMRKKLEPYKRFIIIGIIVIALGIIFSTTLKETDGSLSTVLLHSADCLL